MPRKYTKRSDYWNKFSQAEQSPSNLEDVLKNSHEEIIPASAGEAYYTEASCVTRNVSQIDQEGANRSRRNRAPIAKKPNSYKNIEALKLPYEYSKGFVSPRHSIHMCQKAYANVPIFRNAIDVMAEFSNSDIYLEGGSEKSKQFIGKKGKRQRTPKI